MNIRSILTMLLMSVVVSYGWNNANRIIAWAQGHGWRLLGHVQKRAMLVWQKIASKFRRKKSEVKMDVKAGLLEEMIRETEQKRA